MPSTARSVGKDFRLIVAIADVSHYVRDADALDVEARERGTSVYFPRRVIPMLPEELSNELCSLKPDVDRLCMACEMSIATDGDDQELSLLSRSHALARSSHLHAGMGLAIATGQGEVQGSQNPAAGTRNALHAVQGPRRRARALVARSISKRSSSSSKFDPHGKIETIVPVVRNDAHKIIEECMLAANVCTAEYLLAQKQPALYRVHEGPTPEKLAALKEFLAGSALSIGGGENPTPGDYAKLLTKIKDRPDFNLLQTVLLRSLQQAVYSPDNEGHFGLGYDAYTHFTSPIRRYPDLLVHRCIKACLAGERYRPVRRNMARTRRSLFADRAACRRRDT